MDARGLTALKDGMERYKTTVKDSKFAPLRKKCDTVLLGFPKQMNSTSLKTVEQKTVDEAISLACQSIAVLSTDPIIRAALDILEVALSFELTKDSKATGTVLRSICATPRGRGDDLTHKLLRNLSRCEVHHFVDVQVFELICSTIFELLNQSAVSSSIDASCRAGLAHLLANRLVRYQQPRQEGESDEIIGTPDYVVSVVLMKATEIEASRADTFFEIVGNLFRECPEVLVQPKSADLVLRHVLPRCLGRPKHPTSLHILGSIVAVFEQQAFPFAEIIFNCALIPALQESTTAVDAMTVFLDSARKPQVISGLLSYYDCSGGARSSLVQEWIKAVCKASTNDALKNIRVSLALLLQLFVDFFAKLQEQEPIAANDEIVRLCKEQTSKRLAALMFNEDAKKGVAQGVKTGVIASNTPKDIATFLRASATYLDKMKLGEYIAKRERKEHLIAFVDTFDFAGVEFSEGIRMLMGVFKMVGEADIVDRTTDYYAARYVACNPGSFLLDTAGILAFSTMMLNTDLHSPHVKTKMQMDEFVRNNRGIDNGKDLPREVLEGIYNNIKNKEIVLEDALSDLSPQDAAAKAREIYGSTVLSNNNSITSSSNNNTTAVKNDDDSSQQQSTNNESAAPAASSSLSSGVSNNNITTTLDKRISGIILQGAVSPLVQAISELLVTTSSREPAVKAVSKLIKLVCEMNLTDSLQQVVKAISVICENSQFTSSLRLSALILLVDSVMQHLETFRSSWSSVARSIAACAKLGPEAGAATDKLIAEIPNLSGDNLSAFVAGFIEVVAESAEFLTPDSFLWRLITQAVEFTCQKNPDLWKKSMWKQAFPQLKKAIYNFPNNQCADAIDRLCSASLVASPQCLELVLFVANAFHSSTDSNNNICLTFLRTTSQVDLFRCDLKTDFSKLAKIYETLGRSTGVVEANDDFRLKAFDAFKSNVFDVVINQDNGSDFGLEWQTAVMRVASIFADALASGAADQDLYRCVKFISRKNSENTDVLLLCCGSMTDLVISSEVTTERRETALAQILSLYTTQVDSATKNNKGSEKTASVIVSSVLIPLFETLVDSVASLYAKIARTRIAAAAAAQRERQQQLLAQQELQRQQQESSTQRKRGATTAANNNNNNQQPAASAKSTADNQQKTAQTSSNSFENNTSFGTSQSLLLSKSESDFQATAEAAIATHVGLLVRLFNNCVPLDDEDVSPSRGTTDSQQKTNNNSNKAPLTQLLPFETVFLVECLRCAFKSSYECTQQIAMVTLKQLANQKCYTLIDQSIWKKVTDLIYGIMHQTTHAFRAGETMQDVHMRFWGPLLLSVHAHSANLSNPSPLVSSEFENGKRLSQGFSDLLASCANSKNRNANMLEFEKDVLKLASQIAVSSKEFNRIGDIGQTISTSLLEASLPHSSPNATLKNNNSIVNNNNSPSKNVVVVSETESSLHSIRIATQFVEWIAHIENMELFVSAVKAAYPALCDLMKCGDCSVGTALSLVFHRLAPVVVGMP